MAGNRYAMTKLGPGEYVVPSNDAHTLWMVSSYEDGKAHGLDRGPDLVTLWVTRSTPFPQDSALSTSEIRALPWREVETSHRTRKAALESIFGKTEDRGPVGELLP